jgi:transcriptional regulator with XRE-family HTH domain
MLLSVVMGSIRSVGDLLREWRRRRRLSQLDLAMEAEISARHLSFLETGRSQPSRDMLLHLAEQLQIPLRERNVLLNAAGFASVFPERQLADPALDVVRKAIDVVLTGHNPFPAFASIATGRSSRPTTLSRHSSADWTRHYCDHQ